MSSFQGQHDAQDDQLDSVSLWAYSASAALVLLALPLFAFPRLVMFLMGGLDDDKSRAGVVDRRDQLTPLERFLCLQLALLYVLFQHAPLFRQLRPLTGSLPSFSTRMVALACLVLLFVGPRPPQSLTPSITELNKQIAQTAPPPPHVDSSGGNKDAFRPPSRLAGFAASRSTTGPSVSIQTLTHHSSDKFVPSVTILTPLLLISSFTSFYSEVGSLGVAFSTFTAVGGLFGAWVVRSVFFFCLLDKQTLMLWRTISGNVRLGVVLSVQEDGRGQEDGLVSFQEFKRGHRDQEEMAGGGGRQEGSLSAMGCRKRSDPTRASDESTFIPKNHAQQQDHGLLQELQGSTARQWRWRSGVARGVRRLVSVVHSRSLPEPLLSKPSRDVLSSLCFPADAALAPDRSPPLAPEPQRAIQRTVRVLVARSDTSSPSSQRSSSLEGPRPR